MLTNALSYKGNQVSRSRVVDLVGRVRDEDKIARLTEAVDEIGDYYSDIFVVDGDLHVPGDLDLAEEKAFLLVVVGDLRVDGCYTDSDDPESFLLVTGDMRARDVVTAGWLEVHGDLRTDRLVGDYNDCSAHIGGSVHASLFYGEEHFFTIEGELAADAVIGRPRLMIDDEPEAIAFDDPRLLDHFDRALLRVHEDESEDGTPILDLDGIKDFRELKRRVFAGLPFKTG